MTVCIGAICNGARRSLSPPAAKTLADRTGDVIAYAQRLVTVTDWVFTAGGVALILIGPMAWSMSPA